MQPVPPAVNDLARRLLAHEVGSRPNLDASAEAIERIHDKLGGRMNILVGQLGFAALVSRALHLARREHPILTGISIDVQSGSGLQGMREFAQANDADPATATTALVAIVGHTIELLVTFIGDELSMRLIAEIWPNGTHLDVTPNVEMEK